jgi:hypothetical protein
MLTQHNSINNNDILIIICHSNTLINLLCKYKNPVTVMAEVDAKMSLKKLCHHLSCVYDCSLLVGMALISAYGIIPFLVYLLNHQMEARYEPG